MPAVWKLFPEFFFRAFVSHNFNFYFVEIELPLSFGLLPMDDNCFDFRFFRNAIPNQGFGFIKDTLVFKVKAELPHDLCICFGVFSKTLLGQDSHLLFEVFHLPDQQLVLLLDDCRLSLDCLVLFR